jgi:hypothetical protein
MSETQPSALQAWQGIVQTPELVDYFRGVFERAGIQVEETGEGFTVAHTGAQMTLTPGIEAAVDFVVPLKLANIHNLVGHTRDGKIDAAESWRIVQVLFSPMTQATLRNPVFTRRWLLWLAGVEPRIHVHLLHPNQSDAATHTLIWEGERWRVLAGLHGSARRTYRITAEQALAYQRQVFAALRRNSVWQWCRFALWYRRWRKTVSI